MGENEQIETTTIINTTESFRSIGDAESAMTGDDAAWIITNAFIIFTMQTGFGLLESACVSRKNEANIMIKNVVDIVFGGLTYWMFGYGLSFGDGPLTTPFCGVGDFLLDTNDLDKIGTIFTTFIFQLSFATTATTIVSGAMAERCNFGAYCIFSFLNTVVYCVPAGWLWGKHGFLFNMGVVDIAGSGGVHLVGGISALISAAMLGPRNHRYENGTDSLPMGCPTNAVLGLFVLWWGWLSFNCGSTFGVTNHRWKYAARAAASTITASFGGGIVGMFWSYFTKNRKWDVGTLINSILSALVAVTAGCSLYHPWEGIVVGFISAILTCLFTPLLDHLHIDDPVGAVAVHAVGGAWGLLSCGIFPDSDQVLNINSGGAGLFKGGGWYMLGVQALACVCLSTWSAITTFVLLFSINFIIPIRMSLEDEILGSDFVEHGIPLEYPDGHYQSFKTLINGKLPMQSVTSLKSPTNYQQPQKTTLVSSSLRKMSKYINRKYKISVDNQTKTNKNAQRKSISSIAPKENDGAYIRYAWDSTMFASDEIHES
ncbi:hypothetical protein CHUAL_000984 [Chamberlinius hualienensis]